MKAALKIVCAISLACAGLGVVTAPSSAAPACEVTYTVINAWPGGFQGSITVKNTGDAWTSWALRFALPAGQSATQGWGGNWRLGASPTVTNASYNGSVGTNASVSLGFIGSGAGTGAPGSFGVNGVVCAGGGGTTTTTTSRPTTTTTVTTTTRTTTTSRTTTTRPTTTTSVPTTTTTQPAGTPVARWGQLRVCGAKMCAGNGTAVQLRGVSSMWLNWENNGFAQSAAQLRWMRDTWGLTVIRAAMGVEPAGAYLSNPAASRAQVETIINNAVAAGVYVIVDYHAHEAHLSQSQAVAFFSDLARRYGHLPNVLWEPWNEPLAVDWTSVIKPYHQAVVSAIRASDPDNIVILGTPTWSQGIDKAQASPVAGSNLMYTVHFYSCSHGSWLRDRADAARRAGLAIFVTEWGATHADGGLDGQVCAAEGQAWIDWMRTNQISWTAWKLDDCIDSSCLLSPGAPVNGNWDNYLHGHASLVRAGIRG